MGRPSSVSGRTIPTWVDVLDSMEKSLISINNNKKLQKEKDGVAGHMKSRK